VRRRQDYGPASCPVLTSGGTWAPGERLTGMSEYEGKHRGEPAGPWMVYEPRHRAPGGEMDHVGYVLLPVADEDAA
jgi:hypothetical protein